MTLEHLFPEVGCLVPAGVTRIARPVVASLVEGKEVCIPARKARGHIDFVRIDREVNQRPFLKLEYQVIRIAVVLVLRNSIPPGLAGHGVLEFCGRERDAIERQNHIQRIAMTVRVTELARDGETVGVV